VQSNHKPMKGRREPKYRGIVQRSPSGYRGLFEATGSFWHWPEYGTANGRPATAPIRRAVAQALHDAGGDFKNTPKEEANAS
jgi:hypothetical protein